MKLQVRKYPGPRRRRLWERWS